MKRAAGILSLCAVSLALPSLSAAAATQDDVSFAGKTITMTIGFGAGGSVDLYGRTLGQFLTQHLPGKPSLVVINQVGAGGVVALNGWVARGEPNGTAVTLV